MNEEMRSATEELETSKEELQSVNEELTTVNHELKSNVEELSRTNADLNNLMASSDIGTIFLDRQLRIHRFTPAAQKIFNLIPADMGRPISDITSSLKYEGFIADAEQVLQDLHTIEREMQVADGTWFMTRIAPYRTSEDRIAGVVATFIDITPPEKGGRGTAGEPRRSPQTGAHLRRHALDHRGLRLSLRSRGPLCICEQTAARPLGPEARGSGGQEFLRLALRAGAGGEAAPTGRGGLHDRRDHS